MRFSAPVWKHWLGSFSIVLPPSSLRRAAPGSGGPRAGEGGDTMGGGGGGPAPERIYIYICIYVYVCMCIYVP